MQPRCIMESSSVRARLSCTARESRPPCAQKLLTTRRAQGVPDALPPLVKPEAPTPAPAAEGAHDSEFSGDDALSKCAAHLPQRLTARGEQWGCGNGPGNLLDTSPGSEADPGCQRCRVAWRHAH